MKTAKNLAWLSIGILNVGVGYFIWDWAAWPLGGAAVGITGLGLTIMAVNELRQPKRVVKFNIYKGVVHG